MPGNSAENQKNGTSKSAYGTTRYDSAPRYVADAGREIARRASKQRIDKLAERVDYYSESCRDLRGLIGDAEERRDGLPGHDRGWPIAMVVVLGFLTVVLEYIPASMFTMVFLALNDTLRFALTCTFTAIGVTIAVVLGELLRRLREPERQQPVDSILLGIFGVSAVLYLAISYVVRGAYTSASAHAGQTADQTIDISPVMEAMVMTSLAAFGIALTVVSAYKRESRESFAVHRYLGRLNRELQAMEANLRTNRSDLERVIASVRENGAATTRYDGAASSASARTVNEDAEAPSDTPPPTP